MNADRQTEMKFQTASMEESVKLVSPEVEAQLPLTTVSDSHEAAETIPTSPSTSSQVDSAVSFAPSNAPDYARPSLSNSAGGYSSSNPWFDFKQLVNAVYFIGAAWAAAELLHSLECPLFCPLLALFSAFAGAALVFSINTRAHLSDFAVTLSSRTRSRIRMWALVLPLPLIACAMSTSIASHELTLGEKAFDNDQYEDAILHLNTAARLNPFSEGTIDGLSRVFYMTGDDSKALAYAEQAIAMDPKDSYAWSDEGRALRMLGRYPEAIVASEKAVGLDATNAQAFASLADLYFDVGKYDMALEAAQKHATMHFTEAYAFELKAKILDQLGRVDEAAAARAENDRLLGIDQTPSP
jgi:tetratricopeptide (TPR) repeat protein